MDERAEDDATPRPPVTLEHAQIMATVVATSKARRAVLVDPAHPCNEAFLLDQARMLSVDRFRRSSSAGPQQPSPPLTTAARPTPSSASTWSCRPRWTDSTSRAS